MKIIKSNAIKEQISFRKNSFQMKTHATLRQIDFEIVYTMHRSKMPHVIVLYLLWSV